jgi:thiamine-monophosphate kinase
MQDPWVGELSEGEILSAILRELGPSAAEVGPGDDAAVLTAADGRVVATVDTLVHGPDFRLAWSSGFDLGWKAAAVNLADIAAMGARPTSLLVALAMPDATRLSFVVDLARGLRAGCDELAPGCVVEGGDLTVSDVLTVAVTALGTLEGRPAVRRSGARVGDIVAATGGLGDAARGLRLLFDRFRDAAGNPIAVDRAGLTAEEARELDAQLRPSPHIADGVRAAIAGASAMMDLSDGLVLDAGRMAAASGVTLDLHRDALGPHPDDALSGGEDHGLLATFPTTDAVPDGFQVIGVVRERGEAPVLVDGARYESNGGWDPYRDWDASLG